MKRLTHKISRLLGVFAIASFAVCAMFTFASGTRAFADAVAPSDDQFFMEKGAYVRNAEDLGIRFVTNIDKTWYEQIKSSGATVAFGTIITNTPTDGSDITFESENVKDVKSTSSLIAADEETVISYCGSVVYNELTGENEKLLAPLVKLTGRGYVKVTVGEETTIYYAKSNDNSRSMRDVAVAAQEAEAGLEGLEEYTKVTALTYADGLNFIENGSETNTYSKSEFTAENGNLTAFVGASELQVAYTDGTITLNTENLPDGLVLGKNYNLTVFADAQKTSAFSARIKFVTKALKTKEDLAIFDYTIERVLEAFTKDDGITSGTVNMAANKDNTLYTEGYYYLANDIDATGVTIGQYGMVTEYTVGGVTYNFMPNGDTSDVGEAAKYIGFRGVFEGNGHTISGINLGRAGFFGNICGYGGKDVIIRNVGFADVKLAAENASRGGNVIAAHVFLEGDASVTMENIYIEVAKNQRTRGIIAYANRAANMIMNNILIVAPELTGGELKQSGSMFAADFGITNSLDSKNKKMTNIYVVSNVETIIDRNSGYKAYGVNETEKDTALKAYTFTGVKRYTTLEDMKSANNDYTSFTESGYWQVVGGELKFK